MNKFANELNQVATMLWRQIPLSIRLSFLLEPLYTYQKTSANMSEGDYWCQRQKTVVAGADPLLESIFRESKVAMNRRELNQMFWAVARKIKADKMIDPNFDFGKAVEPVIKAGFRKFKGWGAEEDDAVMFIMEKLLHQPGRGNTEGRRWDVQLKDGRKRGKYEDLAGTEAFFRIKIKNWMSDWGRYQYAQGMGGVPRESGPQKVREKKPGQEEGGGFDFSQIREPIDMRSQVEARDLFEQIYKAMRDPVNQKLWKYVVENNVTDVLKPTGGTGKLLRQVMQDAMGKEISPARASQLMKGKFIPDLMQAAKTVGAKQKIKGLDRNVKNLVARRLRMINNIRVVADQVTT